MKFFGFENDEDDYDDHDDYTDDRRSEKRTQPGKRGSSSRSGSSNAGGKIIIYNGIADDSDKRRLREAFDNGAMILIDLHNLDQRDFEEKGKDFITFMGGIAFGRNGDVKFIEPSQYLMTPRSDMYEIWPEESDAE